MKETPLGLLIPEDSDAPDGPNQIGDNAEKVDDLIVPATQERLILATSTPISAQQTAGVYLPGVQGKKGEEGGINYIETTPIPMIGLKVADYEVAGKTPKLRLRAQIVTNNTAPGITLTPSLRPVTSTGTALHYLILGAALGGVAMATPAANAELDYSGAQFDFPADGLYTTGLLTSGTLAESARALINVQVMLSYV